MKVFFAFSLLKRNCCLEAQNALGFHLNLLLAQKTCVMLVFHSWVGVGWRAGRAGGGGVLKRTRVQVYGSRT